MSPSERERILVGLVDLARAYRDGNAEEGERLLGWFVGRPERVEGALDLLVGRLLGPEALALEEQLRGEPDRLEQQLGRLREFSQEVSEGALKLAFDVDAARESANDLTEREVGALILLPSAGVLYRYPSPELRQHYGLPTKASEGVGFGERGRSLVRRILAVLPRLDPLVRHYLIGNLVDARTDAGDGLVGSRWLMSSEYYGDLQQLTRHVPRFAAEIDRLGAHMLEGMDEQEQAAWSESVLLGDDPLPSVVEDAVERLFRSGGRADRALELVYRIQERHAQAPRVRSAVARAVAHAAPVDTAVDFFERVATGPLASGVGRFALEIQELSRREGAAEHFYLRYVDARALGSDPRLRRVLVMGCMPLGPDFLWEVTTGDPDPLVRGQAAITFSYLLEKPTEADVAGLVRMAREHQLRAGEALTVLWNLALRLERAGNRVLLQQLLEQWIAFLRDALRHGEDPEWGRIDGAAWIQRVGQFLTEEELRTSFPSLGR